jgi:asparagine N-glycosylation enzyme membrane subunit Stt3
LAVPSLLWKRLEAKYFLLAYAAVALYFSKKMNHLVLLLAPAVVLAISGIFTWTLVQVWELVVSVLSPLKTVKKVSTNTVNGAVAKAEKSS